MPRRKRPRNRPLWPGPWAACLGTVLGLWAVPGAAQDFTTLKGHGGPVMAIDVAADGRVATASFDNSVGLWTGRDPVWLDAHDAAVTTVRFLPDGRILSAGDDFSVLLWEDGEARALGTHKGKVTDVVPVPDGGFAASASWDGTVALWSFEGGEPTWIETDGGANDLAFSPDGTRLYVATTTGAIDVYELGVPGAPHPLVTHGFGVNRLNLAPDGSWLAYGAVDGTAKVVNTETGALIADFTPDRRPILALAHHPGTGRLAVGDGQGFIMLIDTATWSILRGFRATINGPIWALAFSPDGAVIWAAGLDDVAYGWPVALIENVDPAIGEDRSFLRDASTMPNGERQFMRKCSICHALGPEGSRKAGPTLQGLFGRRAGTVPGYRYSPILTGSDIVWSAETIDRLFDIGPDHFIPGSKMPMQVIAAEQDRRDLIEFLRTNTGPRQ